MNKLKIKDLFTKPFITEQQPLPANMYWPELVCQGHVWVARMNYLVKFRNFALLAVIGTLAYDLAVNIPLMTYLTSKTSQHEASAVERWVLSPFNSAKQAISSEAPDLDMTGRPVVQSDDLDSATNVSDLPGFISENLKSLNTANKLAYACDSSWNGNQGWSHNNEFSVPKCKLLPGEVWLGSVVSQMGNEKLLFGVFRKVDGEYKYWNVTLPNNRYPTYMIPGHQSVTSESVPRAVGKAFPEFVKGVK